MLKFWSNGRLKAVPHCIINKSSVQCRYSVGSFWSPNLRTTITPLQNGDKDLLYNPIVCGEYLTTKYNKHFDYDKSEKDLHVDSNIQ